MTAKTVRSSAVKTILALLMFFVSPLSAYAVTIDVTTGTFPFSFDGKTFGTGGTAVAISGGVVTSTGVSYGGSIIMNTDIVAFDTTAGDGYALATFGTSGTSNPDFSIYDGYGNLLIGGNFVDIMAFGVEGSGANGTVASLSLFGDVLITGGSIFNSGPGASLIATFRILTPASGLPADVFVDDGTGSGKYFSGIASSTFSGEAATVPVPEPSTLFILGAGLLGAGALRLRKTSSTKGELRS